MVMVDDRRRALWVAALATGLRQGELLALRWDDVDVDAATLMRIRSAATTASPASLALWRPPMAPLAPTCDPARFGPQAPAERPSRAHARVRSRNCRSRETSGIAGHATLAVAPSPGNEEHEEQS